MRATYITGTITYVTETCIQCGVGFAMDEDYYNNRRADKKSFYCPNGHAQHYLGETDADKLHRARAQITHLQDQKGAAERSAAAYKGQVTKIKNRVENGVCIHCDRSFANLRNHMATVHSDGNQ